MAKAPSRPALRERHDRRQAQVVDDAVRDPPRALDEGSVRGDRRVLLAALLGMVNHSVQWYRPTGRLEPGAIAHGSLDLVLSP